MSGLASYHDPEADAPDAIAKWLKWILFIIALLCSAAMIAGTVQTYRKKPPLPAQFVSSSGAVLFTSKNIVAGKAAFQAADLGDYGSLYGMGAYFGEDWTAKYLMQLAHRTTDNLAESRFGKTFSKLGVGDRAAVKATMRSDLQGIKLRSTTVKLPAAVARAVGEIQSSLATSIRTNDFTKGFRAATNISAAQAKKAADFIIYSAITTVARRPGTNVSWTQNWPYEPFVGNVPSQGTFLWTWISFMATFTMFGAVVFIFEHWINREAGTPRSLLTTFYPLTRGQGAAGLFFLAVGAFFLIQIAAGGLLAHYYSDRANFYGVTINELIPFRFLRDVHIQGAVIWIGLAWLGAGLFIAPLIAGREGKLQGWMNVALLSVTVLVVLGALTGDYLGIMGWIRKDWFWIGNQGLAYLELGRAWQFAFAAGLLLWAGFMARAIWPRRADFGEATRHFWTGRVNLEHLLWASTLNIAFMYWFGMIPLTGINHSFTLTDFWRWWVVHMWVEQAFEFFFTIMIAYLLMAVGLVSRSLATRTALFDTILIFLGGILGTGHHMYWVGEPGMWVPIGSIFSFIEVMPLLLLVMEASREYRALREKGREFPYKLAFLFIFGSTFWNFLGAGVFGGGTINAPLVNYYEHGTFLTLNHAHTALFGAFGEMAIGLIYFCLRYAAGDSYRWSDRPGVWAFGFYNAGLVLWIALNFFPIGWGQLDAVYTHGYAYARSLKFYDTTILWQWLRFPGDLVFTTGTVIMVIDFLRKFPPFFDRLLSMVTRRVNVEGIAD